jgi:hypothetical protein
LGLLRLADVRPKLELFFGGSAVIVLLFAWAAKEFIVKKDEMPR